MKPTINTTTEFKKDEFESRLKELTAIGEPLIMGSPFAVFTIFGNTNKPFLGEFDKTQFRLTRNSVWPFNHTGYTINGNYDIDADGELKVQYVIRPMWFVYLGARLFPLIFMIAINVILGLNSKAPVQVYLVANAFLIGMLLLAIKIDSLTKRRFERRFQLEFRLKP